jgi:hypothetical protein
MPIMYFISLSPAYAPLSQATLRQVRALKPQFADKTSHTIFKKRSRRIELN